MKVAIQIPRGWRRLRTSEPIRQSDRRSDIWEGAIRFRPVESYNHRSDSIVIRSRRVPAEPDETHPPKGWCILHKDTPLKPGDVYWSPQWGCWSASFRAHSGNTRQVQSNTYARKR